MTIISIGLYSSYSKHFLDFQGFIVPHLLSVEECEEVIQMGEDWGIGEEDKRIRTSNRTKNYVNEELTIRQGMTQGWDND